MIIVPTIIKKTKSYVNVRRFRMNELLHKVEVYNIVGAAMEVYNQLGNGFLEAVYQEALALELQLRDIPFTEHPPLELCYKGKILQRHYIPDMLLYDKIIVELKAISILGNNEQAQLLHYLKATGLRLGLLINFGSKIKLEWERKIL
jgi:GxxExxY protein